MKNHSTRVTQNKHASHNPKKRKTKNPTTTNPQTAHANPIPQTNMQIARREKQRFLFIGNHSDLLPFRDQHHLQDGDVWMHSRHFLHVEVHAPGAHPGAHAPLLAPFGPFDADGEEEDRREEGQQREPAGRPSGHCGTCDEENEDEEDGW